MSRQVALRGVSRPAPLRSRAAAARGGGDTGGLTSNYVTREVPPFKTREQAWGATRDRIPALVQPAAARCVWPEAPSVHLAQPEPGGSRRAQVGDLSTPGAQRRSPRRLGDAPEPGASERAIERSVGRYLLAVRPADTQLRSGSRSRSDGSALRGSGQNVRACMFGPNRLPGSRLPRRLESSSRASARTAGLGGSSGHRVIGMQVHFRPERIFSIRPVVLYLLRWSGGEKKIHVQAVDWKIVLAAGGGGRGLRA